MIPIRKEFLDCVLYVYPTLHRAEKDEKVGGSGFLVGVPLAEGEVDLQLYAVTNRHVIEGASYPVLRLNTADGKREFI